MLGYLNAGLNSTLFSTDALTAAGIIQSNPHVVLSMYYKLDNSGYYLMGAPEVTEIVFPGTWGPCADDKLVSNLNFTCLSDYRIVHDGRLISGADHIYSSGDGIVSLIYDFSTFIPSTNTRMVSVDLNIFDPSTTHTAIGQIVFERRTFGDFKATSFVSVVPHHFMYLGGNGTTGEWALVVGNFIILVLASVAFLAIVSRRIVQRKTLTLIPSVVEIMILAISILCITSFGYQFSIIFSTPLSGVNLGIMRSVNLSEVAHRFVTVNALNSIILLLNFATLIFALSGWRGLGWIQPVTVAIISMICFSLLLTVQFGKHLTFGESFMLLTRIGLRYISNSDFEYLTSQGYGMATLLVFFSFLLYWLTGAVIGSFISRGEKIDQRKESSPASPQRTSLSVRRNTVTASEYMENEQLLASVEVLGGRALSEITAIKDKVEQELESVRAELDQARVKIGKLRQNLIVKS